jgi:hypothetical protein
MPNAMQAKGLEKKLAMELCAGGGGGGRFLSRKIVTANRLRLAAVLQCTLGRSYLADYINV